MGKSAICLITACVGLLFAACNNKKAEAPAAPEAGEVKEAVKAETVKADSDSDSAALQDKSGHIYKTVRIGEKLWMAENMQEQSGVTCYANTDKDAEFVKKYGCLYKWDEANKVCPAGWRLPTKDDYGQMLAAVGDSPKSRSAAMCAAEFNNGNNASGFGALPAGLWAGEYNRFGQVAMFWTATASEESAADAYDVLIDPGFMGAGIFEAGKDAAYSVRCLKD